MRACAGWGAASKIHFAHVARPSSRLLSAIRQACALAKPPIYSGAKARRPLDAKLEDLSWVAKAKQESAVLLIDLK